VALATLLCAATLAAAPAQASDALLERSALREVIRLDARGASAGGMLRLPLPEPAPPPTVGAASASHELASLARSRGAERVLVGLRAYADLAGVAAEVRALGGKPSALRPIGVLAARVPSGAALVARLRADPRVAYIERDRPLRAAADPFDTVDPATGIKYTWFYDEVRAADALAAAGGGAQRTVSIIDTGLDLSHPELRGRIARTYDTLTRSRAVGDNVGHGTFVAGLLSAIDGNGLGGKGVAGTTKLMPVRASFDGTFALIDVLHAIVHSIRKGADVLNLSLAGRGFSRTQSRAFEAAFVNDVLPVAASGNMAQNGNPIEYPAAALGGVSGSPGIGLSVAASTPAGRRASFSNFNRYVSLAAPGAGTGGCEFGVFSTLPANPNDWDDPEQSCSRTFSQAGARYAYGEGTSFSTPIAAGIAALTWQIEPRLASEQVADVLIRSARQTVGRGWNSRTGSGIVDGRAASALARLYDVTDPRLRASARRRGRRVAVRVKSSTDRTEPGRELAGRLRYLVVVSRNGGRSSHVLLGPSRRPIAKRVRLRGRRDNVFAAAACDANRNCAVKRLGRFRP
jgi:subtilisin family serine protease